MESSFAHTPKIVVVYRESKSHPQPLFDTLAKLQGAAFNPDTLVW